MSEATAETSLSLEEAMAALALSRAEVYRMVGDGKLKGDKVDHRLRFSSVEVARAGGVLSEVRDSLQVELTRALADFAPLPAPAPAPEPAPVSGAQAEQTDGLPPQIAAPPTPPTPAEQIEDLGRRLIFDAICAGVDDLYLDPVQDADRLLYSGAGRRRERARWPLVLSAKVREWLKSKAPPVARNGVAQGLGEIPLPEGKRQLTLTVVPTRMGEHLHVRLHLEPAATDLVPLGYEPAQVEQLDNWLAAGSGLILLADAGDAWSQHNRQRLAQRLADDGRLVVSLEHRLQYRSQKLVQLDIGSDAEGTPVRELWRTVLAMDCDVIIIDEITNAEEAQLAVEAAGGALVLAQLMTGGAAAGIRRLLKWETARESLASHLLGAVERRTARLLCPSCRQPSEQNQTPFTAAGCDACHEGDAGQRAVAGLLSAADLRTWLADESADIVGGELSLGAAMSRAVNEGLVAPRPA